MPAINSQHGIQFESVKEQLQHTTTYPSLHESFNCKEVQAQAIKTHVHYCFKHIAELFGTRKDLKLQLRCPRMASSSIVGVIFSLVLALKYVALQAEARAFFVFGDSLVDSGNNNYLATTARADSPPYGIDYPSHRPTGRFSNGLNIPDLISQVIVV